MSRNRLRVPRKQTARFMLIPLIDVIFLLLTFFMLSSSIEPYSSLTLGEYRQQDEQGGEREAGTPASETRPDLVLAVSRGQVQANGEMLALEGFNDAVASLRREGAETVIVFTRASATVQDVVTVLDALKKAAFKSVTIRTRSGTRQ
jgi:biopolymer transport protein ExbD